MRRTVLAFATLFYVLHAAIHVLDLLSGHLHAGHWWIDLPGVFVPAILLVVLSLPRFWGGVAR
jgi:hypothetical protein